MKQSIKSAATSLNQVPALFRKGWLKPGTVNLDLGGGKYNAGTEYLNKLGIANLVYDPYNRTEVENKAAMEYTKVGYDTVTVNNVLNVIMEPEVRAAVVKQAAEALKTGGVAYFQIYEGDKSGVGRVSKVKNGAAESWQNNKATVEYMGEVAKEFGTVVRKGNVIVATK